MKKIGIKPLGDRVLIEPKKFLNEQKKGGIIIPDSAKDKPQEGVVIALGPGKKDKNGQRISFDINIGDIVLMSQYGGTDVKFEDKEYKIVNSDEIHAIIEN